MALIQIERFKERSLRRSQSEATWKANLCAIKRFEEFLGSERSIDNIVKECKQDSDSVYKILDDFFGFLSTKSEESRKVVSRSCQNWY